MKPIGFATIICLLLGAACLKDTGDNEETAIPERLAAEEVRTDIPDIEQTGEIIEVGEGLTLRRDSIAGAKYVYNGNPVPRFYPFSGSYPGIWLQELKIPAEWYLTEDSLKIEDAKNNESQAMGFRLIYVTGLVRLPVKESVAQIRDILESAGFTVEGEGIEDYSGAYYEELNARQRKMAGRGYYSIGFSGPAGQNVFMGGRFEIRLDQDMGEYSLFYGTLTIDITPEDSGGI